MSDRFRWVVLLLCLPALAVGQYTPIGGPFIVNTTTAGDQNWASNDRIAHGIAIAPNGRSMVAWNSAQNPNYQAFVDIFGQLFAGDGSRLGLEFQANTYQNIFAPSHFGPDVVADGNGNFVMVWSGFVPGDGAQAVGGQRFTNDGAPLGAEFYIPHLYASLLSPAVAADHDGNFFVVWHDTGSFGQFSGLYVQRFDSSGTKLGDPFLAIPLTSEPIPRPSIATDYDGNFAIAWQGGGYAGGNIFVQRFASDGSKLGDAILVDGSGGPSEYPQLARAADGPMVVVWQNDSGRDGNLTGIFGRRLSNEGALLGDEFQVNSNSAGYQNFPDIAMDASGGFVVSWGEFPQGGTVGPAGVRARRYNSDATAETSEMYVSNSGARAAIASAPNGDFTVAWIDGPFGFQDVYAARFAAPTLTPTPTATETNTPPPSPTPTITPSHTPTFTAPPTATASRTSSPTNTPTITATPTISSTPTATASPSLTASITPTVTVTSTSTNTPTTTPSSTSTSTPTRTATATHTETSTATSTMSQTPTQTPSRTPSLTATATPSATASVTSTVTATETPSRTPTFSPSLAPTASATPSATASATSTVTGTETPSRTPTVTLTPTETATVTETATPSSTQTPTLTATITSTPTSTATFTVTNTATPSATNTPTETPTATPSVTKSATASATPTATASPTQTASPSATATVTALSTHTATAVPTATLTSTPTRTSTVNATPTRTSTSEPTQGASTPTMTPTFFVIEDVDACQMSTSRSNGVWLYALPLAWLWRRRRQHP